ncbi:MAG TPA: ABC transporter permease [Ignavibacteria bacterium]|nr:ABC transporter permease [Ignavibacteria bacterium]
MKRKLLKNIFSISLSIVVTFLITSLIIIFAGKSPFDIFYVMFSEVFGSGYGLGQTLFKATPLIIASTGVAICFHASLFNIGAEGQLNIGSFVIALVIIKLSNLPPVIVIPVSILAGFIASGILGYLTALIKIKKGVNEVITTIMMNFIIMAFINYLLTNFLAAEATVRTEKIPGSMMVPKFAEFTDYFKGSSVNVTFVIAIIIAVAAYFVIYKTKWGYQLRSAGYNEEASRYIGLKINKIILISFFIGAGLTSLVGMNFVMGYKGYYELGFSNNIGFTAIAVALLARNNPIGIIFSSLLFGFLDYGGLSVNTMIPKEIMLVVQAVVILSIISIDKISDKIFERVKI